MTSTLVIVLLAITVAAVLNRAQRSSAGEARKVLRPFYKIQHNKSETHLHAYLLEELGKLSLLRKEQGYTLHMLTTLLEESAEVASDHELRRYALKDLPDSIVRSQLQRWHRATRLPAWAVWSGFDSEADDFVARFRELARQHFVPGTA